MLIIGLDASSQFANFGFATGHLAGGSLGVTRAGLFGKDPDRTLDLLASLLRSEKRVLLAIDAPLGWPEAMCRFLKGHVAGQHIPISKNEFFRRKTDVHVRVSVGKNPLEVGADRIARASHHALEVLGRLRQMSGKAIPLAWDPSFTGAAAIEVYPAATLIAHKLDATGYKSSEVGLETRTRLAVLLRGKINGIRGKGAQKSEHAFDACSCLLAGKDFLEGAAIAPEDFELAKKEGWIWVRGDMQKRRAEADITS